MRKKCIVNGCVYRRNARGLCASCYGYANSMILKGLTTWEQLEREGKALPKVDRGSKEREAWFGVTS